ncbi:unnamed protein product [Periconia digitata]|uniref:Uncharacterized protein n=1 Tax=Periconia digitata TaxID=1303443 RepID=A0A9W4U7T5_9PLEO|nr:unnamed protein product [Periconia digitata]
MTAPFPSTEDHIYYIANSIAQYYIERTNWSTWHFWDYYRRLPLLRDEATGTERAQAVSAAQSWCATAPYGSCVDIALQTTTALRHALYRVPELQHYASHVRTLARAGSANQNDLTHCITALLANSFCVVIDFSCNHEAMMIPLGGSVTSMPYHNMHGDEFRDQLRYLELPGGARTIQRVPANPRDATFFHEHDEASLIHMINVRLANELENAPGDIPVPKTKSVKFQTYLDEPPRYIPWVQFNGRPFATTLRMKIDFANRKVLMQVPYRDWLRLEENRYLLQEARNVGIFERVNNAACNLVVFLTRPRHRSPIRQQLDVMARIGVEHDLDEDQLLRMVDSIYEERGPP